MGWKSQADFRAYKNRRSERMAQIGLGLEDRVEGILARMKEDGEISGFVHSKRHSFNDRNGKDFIVFKLINGEYVAAGFGVTISQNSFSRAKVRHPSPQFRFPVETKDETIRRHILGLFID